MRNTPGGSSYPDTNTIEVGLLSNRGSDRVAIFILAHEYGHLIFKNPENLKKLGFSSSSLSKVNYNIYNEFFADLVAALTTRNPSLALKESMIFFSNPLVGMGFLADGHSPPEQNFNRGIFRTSYDFFFSTRRLLWEHFNSNNKTTQSAQEILHAAYIAIGNELKKQASDSEYQRLFSNIPTQEQVEHIDELLLREVKKQLKKWHGPSSNGGSFPSAATPFSIESGVQ